MGSECYNKTIQQNGTGSYVASLFSVTINRRVTIYVIKAHEPSFGTRSCPITFFINDLNSLCGTG